MTGIIGKLLARKGINPEELTPEEKGTLQTWQKILSEGEITVDSVLAFTKNQLSSIERQFKDLDTPHDKYERLVLLHSVYGTIRDIIESPKAERESLEKYLNSLL